MKLKYDRHGILKEPYRKLADNEIVRIGDELSNYQGNWIILDKDSSHIGFQARYCNFRRKMKYAAKI